MMRTNDAAEEHARKSHVLKEAGPACDLVGEIEARRRLSDEPVVAL
jgi:hypothetical protein